MHSKLKHLNGITIISDYDIAVSILKGNSFKVLGLGEYLKRLQSSSDIDFSVLIQFVSNSPFFLENERHIALKKIFTHILGSSNLIQWQPMLEQESKSMVTALKPHTEVDLMELCFSIFTRLLRPIIGFGTSLPQDFELRLYYLQKLVEPLLSIGQLLHLQDELNYLISQVKIHLKTQENYSENSLLAYLYSLENDNYITDNDKLMLLLVAYGATSPLIQTMGNIFFAILNDKEKKYFNNNVFNITAFQDNLDNIIYQNAALLFIHRIASNDFKLKDLIMQKGSVILIDIQDTFLNQLKHSPDSLKNLGFGLGAHYCSGALISKTIISYLIPSFFKYFPNTKLIDYQYDKANHTAKTFKTLIASIQ